MIIIQPFLLTFMLLSMKATIGCGVLGERLLYAHPEGTSLGTWYWLVFGRFFPITALLWKLSLTDCNTSDLVLRDEIAEYGLLFSDEVNSATYLPHCNNMHFLPPSETLYPVCVILRPVPGILTY